MHDKWNLEKRRRNDCVDRISILPCEILVTILTALPLKEAVATSILSKQWRYVWSFIMTLKFHDIDFLAGDHLYRFKCQEQELKDKRSCEFVNGVNGVVKQHRGLNVEQFRACFFLDSRHSSSIDEWIQFAMKKRVQILELKFFIQNCLKIQEYIFPQKLLGLEKGSCGYTTEFKSLKVLQIQCISLTGEVLEYFLSNCPVLERLEVTHARNLVSLRVIGPLIALKYLAINYCLEIKSIEICGVNIVSFIYSGLEIDLLISNVPLLVELIIFEQCFHNNFLRLFFTQFSCCLSNIEILKLHIIRTTYNQNLVFPILTNLKHLELGVVANYHRALHHLTSFLKASPYLQRLVLKFEIHREIPGYMETGKLEKVADYPHHHLKLLEIVGYREHECAVEHVMYVIENVVALEKIVINPVRTWRYPNGKYRESEEVDAEVKARDHAMHYLGGKVPSTIEFICL